MYNPMGYKPNFDVKILTYDDVKKNMCECLNEKAKEYHMPIAEPCTCTKNPFQSIIECKIVMKAPNKGVYANISQWYDICKGKPIEYTYVPNPNSLIVTLFAKFYTWELLVH